MGRQIVYCNECGSRLTDQELAQGRANDDDFRSFCKKCRPVAPSALLPAASSSAPPAKKPPSRVVAAAAKPAERAASPAPAAPSRRVWWIAGGAAGILLLVAVAVLLGGSGSGASKNPEPPAPPEPQAKVDVLPLLKLLEDLQATSQDTDRVLRRCNELEPLVRGTRHEARLREIRQRAEAATFKVDPGRQLDFVLDEVRKIQEIDPRFDRRQEVEVLLGKAADLAGPRRAEAERALLDYRKKVEDVDRAARKEAERQAAEEKARLESDRRGREQLMGPWKDWKVSTRDEAPAWNPAYEGHSWIVITHPYTPDVPATLERTIAVPAGAHILRFFVSYLKDGDWELRVAVEGTRVMADTIGGEPRWREIQVDLAPYAGRTVAVRLENAANGWYFEQGVLSAPEIQAGTAAEWDARRRKQKEIWSPWKVDSSAGAGMPVLLDSYKGHSNVLRTHPHSREKPASLERELVVPSGSQVQFSVWAAHLDNARWEARVRVEDQVLAQEVVEGPGTWRKLSVNLTPYAGKKVKVRLENGARNWDQDYGYWSEPEVTVKK